MKPTKNRVFCPESRRCKVLFTSKAKADNFIKFNKDEIMELNGITVQRSYFCIYCAGWHTTSRAVDKYKKKETKRINLK